LQDRSNMSILDSFIRRLGYSKAPAKQYPGWALDSAEIEGFSFPKFVDNENKLSYFQRVSWVNIAVDKVATIGSGAKWNVKKSSGEKIEDVPNHDFEKVLRSPNPTMSQADLIYSTLAYMSVTNTAYWWLNIVSGKPKEIWLIPTKQISPIPDGNLYIKEYQYDPGDGGLISLSPEEIIPFIGFNPDSMFTGMSNLDPLRNIMDADIAMQSWNKRLFGKNNGKLPGIMAFADSINDDDWAQIQKDVDKASSIRSIMMLRNVKAGGVQWIQAAASQKDMEFLNSRLANRDEIYSSIAPGLASILSVNATEANAKTGKSTLIDFKVYPMLKKIGDVITTKIMPMYEDNLLCEPEDIRVTDRVMMMREMEVYSKTHTVDEVREKYWQDKPLQEVGNVLVNIAQTQRKQPDVSQPIINKPIEMPIEADEPDVKVKDVRPAMLELDKWERKSKKLGKLAEFEAYNIPSYIVSEIVKGMTFEAARTVLKSHSIMPMLSTLESRPDYSSEAILQLAETIDKAFVQE